MIEGEQVRPVAPLGFGEGVHSPAVALFVERARAVAPDFEVDGNGEHLGKICRTLDGIPLAIELAAARIRAMEVRRRSDSRASTIVGFAC